MGHSPEWRYTMRINVTVTYKNGLKDTTMVKNEAEKTYLKNMDNILYIYVMYDIHVPYE